MHHRPEAAAAHGAVAGVQMRRRQEENRRAIEADIAALERLGSSSDNGPPLMPDRQERPYRDSSEDQLNLERSIRQIKGRWSADPEKHATS